MSTHLRISTVLGGTSLIVAMLLAGCGESTNIQPKSVGTVTACSSLLGVTCVTGRFIDDAAFNVDYECASPSGIVRSVTAEDGSFSCPNGSDATFFLANPDDADQQITLGSVKVLAPARIYGDAPPFPIYFYVTPRSLAGDAVGNSVSTRALNITRLLQTLSTDTTSANLPSRRIVISDDIKRRITALTQVDEEVFSLAIASDPAAPVDGTFDYAIAPFLSALGPLAPDVLISGGEASAALYKGLYSTTAGFYLVPGSLLSFDNSFDPTGFVTSADVGAMVGYNLGSGDTFIGSIYALVDRRGRVIANGLYSYGTPPAGQSWALWSDPQPMDLTSSGLTRGGLVAFPVDGDLTKMQFALRGPDDASSVLRLSRGVMRREAVAGSAKVYENLFQETGTDELYGRWSLGTAGSATSQISNGAYTLERTISVATWMNPDLWRDSEVGGFPIPVTVSIYNSDYGNAACSTASSSPGCKMAELRMLILEDGNIISDRYQTCGAGVNPETLVVNNDPSRREVPLGTVSSITDSTTDRTGAVMKTMSLLAIIPNDPSLNDPLNPLLDVEPGFASYLPYLQLGANFGDISLLRVDGAVNRYEMYGRCTSFLAVLGLCTVATDADIDSLQPGIAPWVNNYTFAQAIKANKSGSPSFNTLKANSAGLLRSTRSTCPP